MNTTLTALAGIVALTACTGPVPTVTEVGPNGVPTGTRVFPVDIDDDGNVLVFVNSTAGLLTEDGDLAQYPLPAGYTLCAPIRRANDKTILGGCSGQPQTPGLDPAAFTVFWDASGAVHEIDTENLKPTYAVDINDQGIILGNATQGINPNPWIYNLRTQQFTTLSSPPGSFGAIADDINDSGDIVGMASFAEEPKERAVMWEKDTLALRILPNPGNRLSRAFGINNNGVIVGIAGDAAIWNSADAAPQVLPKPAPPPAQINMGCRATAINDEGRIIGACSVGYFLNDYAAQQGVLWTSEHRAIALQDNHYPIAINSSGRVVASAGLNMSGVFLIDW